MSRILLKPISKAVVDLLLLVGLFLSILSSRHSADSWGSLHCIVSMTWYALMLIHIWQHWQMTKALTTWKVMRRNIITTLTAIMFILLTVSIVLFVGGVSHKATHIHHAVAHIFWMVILVHAIHKTMQFKRLFQTSSIKMKNNVAEKLKKVHTGHVWANTHSCKACWECINACPKQVIGKVNFLWHKHIVFKNSECCTGCKKCIQACPYGVFSEEVPNMFKKLRS